eukprot:6194148-Pleurochrysis_carterae.AAC.1
MSAPATTPANHANSKEFDWDYTSGTPAPELYLAKDIVKILAFKIFEVDDIAKNLNQHLLARFGVVYVWELKNLTLTHIEEGVKEAGLASSFEVSIARLIFPKGTGFKKNASFGEGKEAAKKAKDLGKPKGWLQLKITGDGLRTEWATSQVGGMENMLNRFEFSHATNSILTQYLLSQSAVKHTLVGHTVFMFWILAFRTTYLCPNGKQRVGMLLYRISKDKSPAGWEAFIQYAFGNRRQSRFSGYL